MLHHTHVGQQVFYEVGRAQVGLVGPNPAQVHGLFQPRFVHGLGGGYHVRRSHEEGRVGPEQVMSEGGANVADSAKDGDFLGRNSKRLGRGIVARTVHQTVPPHVDYSLTEQGQRVRPVFAGLLVGYAVPRAGGWLLIA